jgi:hypothetical protein
MKTAVLTAEVQGVTIPMPINLAQLRWEVYRDFLLKAESGLKSLGQLLGRGGVVPDELSVTETLLVVNTLYPETQGLQMSLSILDQFAAAAAQLLPELGKTPDPNNKIVSFSGNHFSYSSEYVSDFVNYEAYCNYIHPIWWKDEYGGNEVAKSLRMMEAAVLSFAKNDSGKKPNVSDLSAESVRSFYVFFCNHMKLLRGDTASLTAVNTACLIRLQTLRLKLSTQYCKGLPARFVRLLMKMAISRQITLAEKRMRFFLRSKRR